MSEIHVLDKHTIDKIAAGEVLERPLNVVKELMENSIDAGATMLSVEIKDGGTSLIRITDNGSGIEKEQIIGYVSRLYKGGKERNMRSLGYRLYIFFYCFMPLRKAIRFPKRAIMAIYRRVFRKNKA